MKLKQGKGEGDLLLALREKEILGWQTSAQVLGKEKFQKKKSEKVRRIVEMGYLYKPGKNKHRLMSNNGG